MPLCAFNRRTPPPNPFAKALSCSLAPCSRHGVSLGANFTPHETLPYIPRSPPTRAAGRTTCAGHRAAFRLRSVETAVPIQSLQRHCLLQRPLGGALGREPHSRRGQARPTRPQEHAPRRRDMDCARDRFCERASQPAPSPATTCSGSSDSSSSTELCGASGARSR